MAPHHSQRASATSEERRRFIHIASAGVAFQAGSSAVDSSTIMAALIFQLTGSPLAVGAVTAILRVGWLSPQLFVGFLAQRRASSMRYYVVGGFGRAACMLALALVLYVGAGAPGNMLGALVLLLWTAYAFVSGIVAVPYNDIVARSVQPTRRSRLLAIRFFGGGVLALAFAAVASELLARLTFPVSYAAITLLAGTAMLFSATFFVAMGEPIGQGRTPDKATFAAYLRQGAKTFRTDRRFRLFVVAQWSGGLVLVAMPFYVVQAIADGMAPSDVAMLLAAQTMGAILSNFLWGWW